MFRCFFLSKKWAPLAYGGATLLFALFYYQVDTAWRFAEWMSVLGDVVSGGVKYSLDQFISKFIYEAVIIAGIFIGIQSVINYVSRYYALYWFTSGVHHYFPNWNKTLRDIDGPAQRFQESIYDFTLMSLGIAKGTVRASLVLCKFVPKIWEASSQFDFQMFNDIPGMLVWAVVFISVSGMIMSMIVGRNLKECEYDVADAKAKFRTFFEFVQRNKNREDSIEGLDQSMKRFQKMSLRLFHNQFWFDIWQGVYGQLWAVLPVTFFGYNVFSGFATYGVMTKIGSALGEVIGAMSFPIWIYMEWTKFRSVIQRIDELEKTVNNPENWTEPKKEEGWEDRRSGENISRAEVQTLLQRLDPKHLAEILSSFDSLSPKANDEGK